MPPRRSPFLPSFRSLFYLRGHIIAAPIKQSPFSSTHSNERGHYFRAQAALIEGGPEGDWLSD